MNEFIFFMLLGLFIIINGIIFYKLLSKVKFNLNGLEIIIFELAFLILLHVGKYYRFYIYQEFIFLYLIILLAYYYLLKTIKTQQYTKIKTIGIYILICIANGLSLYFPPMYGWDALGYIIIYALYSLGTLIYILLMNLTSLIIIKVKKKDIFINDEIVYNKKILIIILAIIPIVYGYIGSNFGTKLYENKAKNVVINYLNEKYGDGDFKITDVDTGNICVNCFAFTYIEGYIFNVSTDYFDEEFEVSIEKNTLVVWKEDFILKYFKYLSNESVDDYYDIEKYFEEKITNYINENILKEYNAEIKFSNISLPEDKLNTLDFKNITLEDFENILEISGISVVISKEFKEEESEEFATYILDIYDRIFNIYEKDEIDNIMRFKFNYNNPFTDSTYYKDGGYVKEEENRFLVYNKAKPIEVKKENKNLLFEVYSSRINCPPVSLYVYDNNTYEYHYLYEIEDNKVKPKTGTYTYDVKKIIDNINNYSENERGPFTLIDSNNNNYTLYDNNVELNEFLKEININLDVCMSFE